MAFSISLALAITREITKEFSFIHIIIIIKYRRIDVDVDEV